MSRGPAVAFVVSLLIAGGPSVRADVPGFQGLGVGTVVADLSGDGRVAVGASSSSAFRWEAGTLSYLPGGSSSAAKLVSQNGSVIVGEVGIQQVRWVNGVVTAMGGLSDYDGMVWSALSSDGSVVVGGGFPRTGALAGVRWANDSLQIVTDGTPYTSWLPTDTTADGYSIVGTIRSQGFRWDDGTISLLSLGSSSDTHQYVGTSVYGISNDGSVMLGSLDEVYIPPWSSETASSSETGVTDITFYRWVNGVPEALAEPPATTHDPGDMRAARLSGDGSTVCISYVQNTSELGAALWRPETGWRDLEDILINDCHFDLTGWTIGQIMGISDDGLTIVGLGTNPTGGAESWIAHVPEPTSMALSLVALGLLGGGRSRRCRR